MRIPIEVDDVRPGDIAVALNGREWPVSEVDSDGWVKITGPEFGAPECFWDYAQVFRALGGSFWREVGEKVEFECNASVLNPGLHIVNKPTLILEGVGQDVPVGHVKVAMEHAG